MDACLPRASSGFGISQGCTLSPLLFVLVMTVLQHDALNMLPSDVRQACDSGIISDCVYADDTLLIGTSERYLSEFLPAVAAAGGRYGMELHWQKFQVLAVQSRGRYQEPRWWEVEASAAYAVPGSELDGRCGYGS